MDFTNSTHNCQKNNFLSEIASYNWLIITVGMLPEKLPDMLPEIIKTNIFIVEKWKNSTILIYLNVAWQI